MDEATEALFEAVREACKPAVWSRGVELVRAGAVIADGSDEAEQRFLITRSGGLATRSVSLFLDDAEWDCGCDHPDDVCEHVAAAAIALQRTAEGGEGVRSVEDAGRRPLPVHARAAGAGPRTLGVDPPKGRAPDRDAGRARRGAGQRAALRGAPGRPGDRAGAGHASPRRHPATDPAEAVRAALAQAGRNRAGGRNRSASTPSRSHPVDPRRGCRGGRPPQAGRPAGRRRALRQRDRAVRRHAAPGRGGEVDRAGVRVLPAWPCASRPRAWANWSPT